jgi:nucleotide-binding universal stress UspA family protein
LAKEWERLEAIAGDDIEIRRALEEGDPAEQILRFAKSHPCDLIVIGTHGRSGINRAVLGSVAERVVRLAPCPVVTLKGADDA